MQTQCTTQKLCFKGLGDRRVEAQFTAERITTDTGGLLVREVADKMDLFEKAAGCFTDYRDPDRREHELDQLLAQRVMGLVQGYEDLNDHDELREDPTWATLSGKQEDPVGEDRTQEADEGKPLASKATLGRLEHAPETEEEIDRYHRITAEADRIADLFVDLFVEDLSGPDEPIILDLDATHDPLHGDQEGKFFHGYYDCYCYLPLYIFCGEELLCAKLRQSNIDPSEGCLPEIERIVERIREKWPETEIILRADSGFARERIMKWCEDNGVDYVFGLAKNSRLEDRVEKLMAQVEEKAEQIGESVRRFQELRYSTLDSWSKKRRVVAKAEHLTDKANPRFVVTSLAKTDWAGKPLYEGLYCARGEMENRIKEQQLGLFADRTSAHKMQVNQMRLWLASLAYVLIARLRKWGLQGTEWARAQVWTLRSKLLKIGALVKVSVRRVFFEISKHYPKKKLFAEVLSRLQAASASVTGATA
jgi:Txe/YoeB family toxin of Txe-Axe toxin-antitoxin module